MLKFARWFRDSSTFIMTGGKVRNGKVHKPLTRAESASDDERFFLEAVRNIHNNYGKFTTTKLKQLAKPHHEKGVYHVIRANEGYCYLKFKELTREDCIDVLETVDGAARQRMKSNYLYREYEAKKLKKQMKGKKQIPKYFKFDDLDKLNL